jgi:nucleoside-diphosphate-sugar epimerase
VRVVVVGATGNVGSSLVDALRAAPEVTSILGIARRLPKRPLAEVELRAADIVRSDLEPLFAGADAVVHLAWAIQPSHDLETLERINVLGSRRVFEAAGRAGVPLLVYGSSVGAYSAGPKDRAVDESWPTDGIPSSFYGRHKAAAERLLDEFEREQPRTRVARIRPGLVFKAGAAAEIRRLFLGPLVPTPLLRRELIRLIPAIPGLRFQAVHSHDVADAYARVVVGRAAGAFNVAADPVLDPDSLARHFGAVKVPVPARLAGAVAEATWRLHLQPTPAGWLDLALGVPLMDCSRARTELGWEPRHTSLEALDDLIDGLSRNQGRTLPPLEPSEPGRAHELTTGVGERQ